MTRRNNILLVALVVIGAGIGAAVLLNQTNPNLEYSPSRRNNRSGPIVIKSKDTISQDSGTYTLEPSAKGKLQVIENYIIFWPAENESFIEDTRYVATFKNYTTTSGEALSIPTIAFTIDKNTPYSALQKEVMGKFGRFEVQTNPFLSTLPYTEAYRYRISYVLNDIPENEDKETEEIIGTEKNWREKKQNYTVLIETLVIQGRSDSLQTYVSEVQKAREEALKWIADQGVDATKDIIYQFIPDDRALHTPSDSSVDIPLD